ncbi:MAG TPA: HAD-IA family hydrolase [Lacunisphaera sp.]|jgi:HAD superfamily hydrolase (TIGR01509 family)
MIRALVFDFDGLILDTETALIDAFDLVHRNAGKTFSRQLAHEAVGRASIHFDEWAAFGADANRAELNRELQQIKEAITNKLPVLPGVLDYLDHARHMGLKVGLASNSGHAHVEGHLIRLGLISSFDFIRCIEDVAVGKPAPDLYRAVIENFGVPGKEAIAFEDSEHGARAAKHAGLWCVAVPGLSSATHDLAHADLILKSLADRSLPDLLKKFGARHP